MGKSKYIIGGIAGVIVLAVVLTVIFTSESDSGVGLPPRAAGIAKKGDAELAAKNYAAAERYFDEAIALAARSNRLTGELLVKSGDLQLEWAKSPVLTQSEKLLRANKARASYQQALRIAPADVTPQRRLTELAWGQALADGQWLVFVRQADALLAMDEQDALTYYRRGVAGAEIARSMGGVYGKNALDDLRRALELKPSVDEYWIAYFQLLQRLDPSQMEQALQQAVRSAPDSAQIHATYGNYLASASRDAEALEQYRLAIKVEPRNMAGYMALKQFYTLRGKEDSLGVQTLMEAKAADPTDSRPYRELALLANRHGQLEQGMAILRQGIAAVKPRTTSSPAETELEHRRVEGAKSELYFILVNTLLDWGETHPADHDKSLAEAKQYRDQISPMGKAAIERVEGRFAAAEGRLDDAARLLEASAADSPGLEAQTAYLLVQVYLAKGEPQKAMPIADKFIQAPGFETNPLGHILKAQGFLRMRQLNDARAEIDAALKTEPGNRTALQVKADIEAAATQPASKP